MSKKLQVISDVIDRASRIAIVTLFALAFIGILYQVFSRYVLNNMPGLNFPWMEEAVRYLFIWIVFLAIAVVYKVRGHAQVEIVDQFLPDRLRRPMRKLVELINSAFFILLFLKGLDMLLTTNGQLSPSLHLNMSWMYASILVCSIICLFHSLHFLANGEVQQLEKKQIQNRQKEKKGAQSREVVNR